MKPKKTRFIYVKPKSTIAKLDFDVMMNSLHSCYLKQEDDTKYYLSSISGMYNFWIHKEEDKHWEIC